MSHASSLNWGPIQLPGAQQATLRSTAGAAYTLSVSLPDAPAPPAGFPIAIVLDGASHFTAFAAITARLGARPAATGVEPCAVVGIESDPPQTRRYDDFTPWPPAQSADTPPGAHIGGADVFVDFLENTALAALSQDSRLDSTRVALIGHSLSAYFALYAATRSRAFTAIGAVSPSIWWHEQKLLAALDHVDRDHTQVFIAVGERERHPTRQMISRAQAIANLFAASSAENFLLAAGEDHASAPFVAFPWLMRQCFRRRF